MSDTLTTQSATLATIPASTVISTDEVGVNGGTTAHVQHVKLVDGASNGTVGVTVGGGVEAAALRVTLANDSTGLVSVDDNGGSLTVDNAALSVTGTGVEATALRVTLATDSTGVLSVDDNGGTLSVDDGAGSLTVDNGGTFAVQASQSGTWTVQPGNTANTTAWKVDGSAVTQPVSGTVTANAGSGTMAVSLASVPSHAVTNAGTFLTQENGAALTALQLIDNVVVVDDAAFTPATTSVMMAGFEFDDTSPDSVNEGDAGAARMSANRNIYTTIRDAAGNERGLNIDASGQLAVTLAAAQTLATVTTVATVTTLTGTTSLTPGTAAANLGKAEDAGHTSGDVGVMALAVRQDTPGASAGTDGDYAAIQVDAAGAVRTSRPRSSTSSAIAQTTQGTTAAQVLAANAARKLVMIQNTGTTILKFALGAGTPTATVYHFALAPCVATDDGNGAAWISDAWTGAIQALSSGASGQMVVTELT